ncbi:19595_t:CDS:2, partial [Racocetra fulgida]
FGEGFITVKRIIEPHKTRRTFRNRNITNHYKLQEEFNDENIIDKMLNKIMEQDAEIRKLRDVFESIVYKHKTPDNNDGSITFDQNLSINRLLMNLRIELCESDEETWININSRLETIFGRSKDLKTQLDKYQKNKYLQLIDILSLAESSLNSFLKEHEGINSHETLRGSNNDEYLIESDDKQTFSKKEFKSRNSIDDECLTESDENDKNDKENHKKIVKQKGLKKEWSTIAHSLLFPESDDLSLQIKFQDNSIYLDLGDNDRSINFDEHQFNFQDNFESIINELKIWKRIDSTLEVVNLEVTYFRIRHYLILFDAYIALFKQARKDTPGKYENYSIKQKIENGIPL